MFNFGNPEDTADLLWTLYLERGGPAIPEGHWEEMDLDDLMNTFAHLYIAVKDAIHTKESQDVIDVFVARYDEVFEALARCSDEFKEAVRTGRHRIVLGYSEASRSKYFKLAGLTSSAS